MATLSRIPFVTDAAYAIDLCFDLDDALTLPDQDTAGYRTSSTKSSESDSIRDALVANIPTVAAAEGVICSVCVEGFRTEEEGGGRCTQVPCGHAYHETCIKKWLSNSNSCPPLAAPPSWTTHQ
ncbi:hypothetical protein M0R45_003412 [Rubus argutus]|uniref:RING-type E3 ubiquitin transferase n=1 Tax=Rubus argutus TaxID=59490 RepID=A0AAW1YFC7_RUBAR